MHHHRFRDQIDRWTDAGPGLLTGSSGGFMACPVALVCMAPPQWVWQQHVYQAAFRQAQAVVRPSVLERVMKHAWN